MRKIIVILLLFQLSLSAQQKSENRPFQFQKEIRISPVSLAYGSINLNIENYFDAEKSIDFWINGFDIGYSGNFIGFGAGLGFRDYFTPERKASYYIEPFIKYQYILESNPHNIYNTLGGGLVLGRKWVLAQRFSIEIFLGPSLNYGLVKSGSGSSMHYPDWLGPINGIWGRAGLNMGYKFN